MKIREYCDADLAALRRMHAGQGFAYPFPDLRDAIFVSKLVLEDDAERPAMASLARLTCEMYLLVDRDAEAAAVPSPRERYAQLLALHGTGRKRRCHQGKGPRAHHRLSRHRGGRRQGVGRLGVSAERRPGEQQGREKGAAPCRPIGRRSRPWCAHVRSSPDKASSPGEESQPLLSRYILGRSESKATRRHFVQIDTFGRCCRHCPGRGSVSV